MQSRITHASIDSALATGIFVGFGGLFALVCAGGLYINPYTNPTALTTATGFLNPSLPKASSAHRTYMHD